MKNSALKTVHYHLDTFTNANEAYDFCVKKHGELNYRNGLYEVEWIETKERRITL